MTNYRGDTGPVGKMRYRITIQEFIAERDTTTGQEIKNWKNFRVGVPAGKRSPRGGEVNFGDLTEVIETVIFRIRHIEGITEKMRIVFHDQNYGIKWAQSVRDGDRYLDIFCNLVKPR